MRGQVDGLLPLDVDALVPAPGPATVGGLADQLVLRLLCVPARPALRAALVRSTGRPAASPVDRPAVHALVPPLAALVLSAPEAQVR